MEIVTGSRLHFGLLHVPGRTEETQPLNGAGLRVFGGAGLMIEEPRLCLEARPATDWSAEGPLATEVLGYTKACRKMIGDMECPPLSIRCLAAPPRHAGFGSGTQLGLCVARLVAQMSGRSRLPIEELARWVDRGRRSAIGAHGFARGGFLVEAGKKREAELSPLIFRNEFPENWHIVIVLRLGEPAIHGSLESRLFDELQNDAAAIRAAEALCRILLLGVLPALKEQDYLAFGESLYEFNRQAGERFAKAQSGAFSSSEIAKTVEALRREGCPAVGQSSWGPAVFAVCRDRGEASRLVTRAHILFPSAQIIASRAMNCGASVRF